MWLMLQQEHPDDYVIASGQTRTVRDFVNIACSKAGFDIRWEGEGIDEKAYDAVSGRVLVEVDPVFFRPAEVELLLGSPKKAEKALGWKRNVSFDALVERMVKNDLAGGKII
jgi:GDPmannose 4,6-dehydratase